MRIIDKKHEIRGDFHTSNNSGNDNRMVNEKMDRKLKEVTDLLNKYSKKIISAKRHEEIVIKVAIMDAINKYNEVMGEKLK